MTAAHRGNTDRPEEILAAASLPAPRVATDDAEGRWEGDGGQGQPTSAPHQ
jgi:hypothetical protein